MLYSDVMMVLQVFSQRCLKEKLLGFGFGLQGVRVSGLESSTSCDVPIIRSDATPSSDFMLVSQVFSHRSMEEKRMDLDMNVENRNWKGTLEPSTLKLEHSTLNPEPCTLKLEP